MAPPPVKRPIPKTTLMGARVSFPRDRTQVTSAHCAALTAVTALSVLGYSKGLRVSGDTPRLLDAVEDRFASSAVRASGLVQRTACVRAAGGKATAFFVKMVREPMTPIGLGIVARLSIEVVDGAPPSVRRRLVLFLTPGIDDSYRSRPR